MTSDRAAPERHADTDLPGPSLHEIGQHPEQAGERQRQRQCAERDRQPEREPEEVRDHAGHRTIAPTWPRVAMFGSIAESRVTSDSWARYASPCTRAMSAVPGMVGMVGT